MVADENGEKMDNQIFFLRGDVESIPKIESTEERFMASCVRRENIVPLIFVRFNKNYGKEGADIIIDSCLNPIFSGVTSN